MWENWNIAVTDRAWETWLERLYNLRRDKRGSHERPHKPVLLLSIIDLLDHGVIRDNLVPLTDTLVATFKRYFEVVQKHDDQPTIQNPFFHLCGDKFWRLVPAAGESEIYRDGEASGAPSLAELRRRTAGGQFNAGICPPLLNFLWVSNFIVEFPTLLSGFQLYCSFTRILQEFSAYSTVTLLARLRGLSTSQPRATAM